MNLTKEKTVIKKLFQTFLTPTFNELLKKNYPEKYGKVRKKFESFKYIFRVKFRTDYDRYPTKNTKLIFFCLNNVVRTQMLFKINEKKVLKFHSIGKPLHCLNINFGDQNKQ